MIVYTENPKELTKKLLEIIYGKTSLQNARLICKTQLLSFIPSMNN